MISSMILLVALALLIIPPVLIIMLPTPWLVLAAPAGVFGSYALSQFFISDFIVNDPGPAGVLILGFFSLGFLINLIALIVRIIRSLWKPSSSA